MGFRGMRWGRVSRRLPYLDLIPGTVLIDLGVVNKKALVKEVFGV